jgi:hypothetical protein
MCLVYPIASFHQSSGCGSETDTILKKFAHDTKMGQTASSADDREKIQIAIDNVIERVVK